MQPPSPASLPATIFPSAAWHAAAWTAHNCLVHCFWRLTLPLSGHRCPQSYHIDMQAPPFSLQPGFIELLHDGNKTTTSKLLLMFDVQSMTGWLDAM